jgi:hypothetical protein
MTFTGAQTGAALRAAGRPAATEKTIEQHHTISFLFQFPLIRQKREKYADW